MSKIGRKPIIIPDGVEIKIEADLVTVKGPKGELSLPVRPEIKVGLKNEAEVKEIVLTRKNNSKMAKSLHGLFRTLLANMVKGVVEGFQKSLKIIGTGYRVNLEGKELVLNLGFSHPVKVKAPAGIDFELKDQQEIIVRGIDKQLVGQVSANLRKVKPPDVYKGKGIRYKNEIVRKKPGKAVKSAAAV